MVTPHVYTSTDNGKRVWCTICHSVLSAKGVMDGDRVAVMAPCDVAFPTRKSLGWFNDHFYAQPILQWRAHSRNIAKKYVEGLNA